MGNLVMDFLLVVATSALAIIAYMQLSGIAENMRVAGEREKKWATLQACDRYNFDSTIHSVTRRIWDKSEGGTSYSDKDAIKHDVISLLNYLDSLAVGVHQGLYVEEIVRDYMELVVKKAVEEFLNSTPPVCPKDGFEHLLDLCNKWEEKPTTAFSDK